MKLFEIKNKLQNKKLNNVREIKKQYQSNLNKKEKNLIDMKIIGITGSAGKSSTAFILHQYLKAKGYKSVLYSSVMVDSPASLIKINEAYEQAIRNEEALLSIIYEAEAYGAEYLILEINESTIEQGILNDVDFDVRVLTNLNPRHNLERYSENTYVSLKEAFFQNINSDSICVIGLQDYDKNLYEELLNLNTNEKLTFSSRYIANVKGVNPNKLSCCLTTLDSNLSGLTMEVVMDDVQYTISTNLLGKCYALNLVCVMTILKALKVFDIEVFSKCIKNLKIPGRNEIYRVMNRNIIIEPHLYNVLNTFRELKEENKINKIKVVIGSSGYGYKNWDERFQKNIFNKTCHQTRQYAMKLLNEGVDYVYLTESDSGKEPVLEICNELQGYLNADVTSEIILDRREAIRKAIIDSDEGDAILIVGRGNRRILCNSENTFKLIKDSEVVEEILNELGW